MKRVYINILLIITFFLQTQLTFSQNHKIITTEFRQRTLPFGLTESVPKQKPKVALVLSGGGARGAAQVGIMKALIENNIEFDLIVGTSIGSVIGGLYVSGYTIDQLDSILTNTNWEEITALTEQRRRTDLFVDQKITEDRNILTLRLSGLTPVIPTSVSTGQKFTNFLNLLIFQAPIHLQNNFDELLIPFRAVCTDIKSGKEVVLADGDLSEAMRASSSVSFLLAPIERDTMLLADGGLVANIPTLAAKNLGADIIIAVNTTSPLRKFEELDVPWYMADQVVSIPLKLLESEALKIADVVIEPKIEHLSTDFKGLDSLIQIGYQTALNQIEEIKSLINNRYKQNIGEKSFQLDDLIYVHHSEPTIDSLSLSYSNIKTISSSEVLNDLYRISKGRIKSIRLTLQQKEDFTIPEFEIVTKPSIKEILINGIKYSQFQNESKYFADLIDKPFNSKVLSDRLIQLLRYYRNSGYALVDVNRVEFDSTTHTLRIETTPGLIDSIIIQGNNKTNISIIQREILIDAGEMFDISKVSNSLTNLNATNLFEQTFAFLDNNGLRKNLIFKVKEKKSGLIRFGIRGDNERNLQVAADLRDENFFGTATELGLLFNGGLKNRYFGIEYRSNRVLKTFFTYNIKSYYDLIDRLTYADEPTTDVQEWSRIQVGEYREIKYGLSIAIGTQIEKLGNIYFEARREKHQIKSIYGSGYEPEYYDFFGIRLGSIFDSQDRYPFPTDGILISVHYETSQKILGGDISYSKIYFSYEAYHTYFSRHTIVPKFVFGFADITLPLAEQFHLGGQNSFFGLRENDFIGRQLFLASLEYRFQFPFKIFFETYFKVRYDLGSAWLTPTSIRYKDFRHGIGVSLSFDTPIGPANFSVGRGFFVRNDLLKKPLSFGQYQFYFEIGYPM